MAEAYLLLVTLCFEQDPYPQPQNCETNSLPYQPLGLMQLY